MFSERYSSGHAHRLCRGLDEHQDLTAQRKALADAGADPDAVYVGQGFTGTTRDRPGLREALAACRGGDALVVTELDRFARSLPDARDIADEHLQGRRPEHRREPL